MAMLPKRNISTWLNSQSQPQEKQEEINLPVKMISVYDLIPNPLNFYELNDMEELETAIEIQGGVTTSLEVKAVENGKFMVVAGHRRRQGVINILQGENEKNISDKVPCIVKEYTKNQEITALIFSNKYQRVRTQTEKLKEFQILKPILKEIYEDEKEKGLITGRFRKFCADFFEISEATVHRMNAMEKLTEEVKQGIEQGDITPTAAIQLTSLSASEQKAVYEDTTKQGTATVKTIKETIKETIKQEQPPQPEMSETEIKIVALNDVRRIIVREIEKVLIYNQDFGRVTVNSIKLERLNLLKQVLENELNDLNGQNIFDDGGEDDV
jgi:ParB-like chromosome segregation protein Spo0J